MKYLLLLLGFLFSSFGGRVNALELFASASISRIDLKIAEVDFDPKLARGSVGIFFWEGIGLEFQGDFWKEKDDLSDVGVTAELSKFQAAYVRLQSPTSEAYSAYVNLGYSELSVLTYPTLFPVSASQEDISSAVFVVGFQKFLNRFPNLAYSLSYEIIYEDDLVDMSAVTFGYSYRFRLDE